MNRGLLTVLLALFTWQAHGQNAVMFRGNAAHTGAIETHGVERLGLLRWRVQTDGPIRSTAALTGGILYVGSSDGGLYALDAASGTLHWRFATQAEAAVVSSPAVAGDLVLFGDRANVFYALDRTTGAVRWSFPTGADRPLDWGLEGYDYITSSPVVDGDQVYFGSGNGALYAVDLHTGTERWRFETTHRIRSSPAVVDGTVYVGGGNGIVYAIDSASGSLQWQYRTMGADLRSADFGYDRQQIYSSPAVVDGMLYIGSRDGHLYALDAATGTLRWKVADGSAWVIGSPAVQGNTLCSTRSSSHYIRCRDADTGDERWRVDPGGFTFSSPAIVGQTVYAGSESGRLLALDVDTGAERWSYQMGAATYASPLLADGTLYIGSDDGAIYALEHTDDPTPEKAVFWDEALLAHASFWNNLAEQRALADYLTRFGYRMLDAQGLHDFMQARLQDDVPSVIVFAMDALPELVAPVAADTVLFRRYLDEGGKVVWLGVPPLLLLRDPETGQVQGMERRRPSALLSVDFAPTSLDFYGVRITAEGSQWGLTHPMPGGPTADPSTITTPLALDEEGRPVAWVRTYGGPSGAGFVLLYPRIDLHMLDDVRQVAEYGILRSPKSLMPCGLPSCTTTGN